MATSVGSVDPGALTSGAYVGDNDADDGANLSFFGGTFVPPTDGDDYQVSPEEGANGVSPAGPPNPGGLNPARPGAMTLP